MRLREIPMCASFGLLLCACAVPPPMPLDEEAHVSTSAQALREMQGTTTGVALRIRQISGGAFQFNPDRGSIRIKPSGCSTYLEGPALRGTWFHAKTAEGAWVKVEIADVLPHLNRSTRPPTEMADAYDYTIKVNGQPLCPAGQSNVALAFPGDLGAPPYVYDPHSTVANFACGGVVNKCVNWGYKPWRVNGVSWPTPGNAFGQCIFLARADYCAQGLSNTEDGTLIDVYDVGLVRPVNQRSPGDPPLDLEALWAPGSVSPARPAALCLAKRRWDALPIKGSCDLQVSDPRLRGPIIPGCAQPTGSGQYCGERTIDEWLQHARATYGSPTLGLLVNDSSYNDIGLYRWEDMGPAGANLGSYTSTGYDIWKAPASPDLPPLRAGLRYHCFEGRVYSAQELRVRPDLLPLYSYRDAAGAAVTTTAAAPPAGYLPASRRLEGYVVGPDATGAALPPQSAGLYLWQVDGRYVTSTSAAERPATAQLLGYLPRSQADGVPLCDSTLPSSLSAADFPSPLQITCPTPLTVECESGTGCAAVAQPPPACGKAGITVPPPTCYPLGANATQYSAVDPRGQTASCTSTIRSVDTRPPVVQGAPAYGPLWPPNHRYQTISLADCGIQVQDQCEGALDWRSARAEITCVTSDEPNNCAGGGGGPDIILVDATRVKLRVERQGGGDGRVYRIGFSVRDSSGNVGTGSCQVSIPHNGAASSAVDSGVKLTVCR